ncbi:hypothetical protein FBUS_08783 [Fasciolopsis buskii]|uniref:Uncharacterized protein n=1 Tax=Fasciolopsis buskii TaxID=27845 RepID=A0A8E0VH57_9TREM|nr:hypothetical protein FBUS_08783 [Fasciolopsis buski]
MGLMTKMLCLVACAIGVVCTVAPIIVERESVKHKDTTDGKYKGAVTCMFIAFFISTGGLIVLFVTLCCSCNDLCMGIVIVMVGCASMFFAICAYALMKNSTFPLQADKPNAPEWLFGSIVASAGVILCSLTMAVS